MTKAQLEQQNNELVQQLNMLKQRNNPPAPDVQRDNNIASFKRIAANFTPAISSDMLVQFNQDKTVTYGLLDPVIWDVKQQKYIPLSRSGDSDEFQVTASNIYEAKSEFWSRIRIYTDNRFGGFVKIEIRKIHTVRD